MITFPCYLYDLLFGGGRPKALVAGQEDRNILPDEDKSNICKDPGASVCVTGSLENTINVVEKEKKGLGFIPKSPTAGKEGT